MLSAMRRTDVVLVESDRNKASSHDKRAKLARGFGLSIDDFDAYVRGDISVAEALRASTRGESAAAREGTG